MKLAIFPLLFVLAATALTQPAGNVKQVALNQEFDVKVGETVKVGSTGLKISFTAVAEDSRCPKNVTCVWAGNAKINLKLSKAGKRTADINLNTGLEPKHQLYYGYDVKLVSLNPYPEKDVKIKKDDYVATLVISRK